MLFPNGASQRGFDESSPHHPSKLRRTDDFTVVTDKGSHLPIPMPKKENGGGRGSGERTEKASLEITALRRNSIAEGCPVGTQLRDLEGGARDPPGGGGPAGGSLANPTQGSVGAVLT